MFPLTSRLLLREGYGTILSTAIQKCHREAVAGRIDAMNDPGAQLRRSTVELTMTQALVRYLQAQWSERDGVKQRLIPRIFGIFGHGNVVGLGEALEEYGADLPFHQAKNEEMMVHAASGYAKACNRLATFACTASIGPGSTNMVTGAAAATANP